MDVGRLVWAATIVLVAWSGSARADGAGWFEGEFVHCYDRTRDLVRRLSADSCNGEIVSTEQAAQLRASRINHVRRNLDARPPLVPGRTLAQTGSGFFVSDSGYVLTNWHVVHECRAVSIETPRHTTSDLRACPVDRLPGGE